MSTDSAGAQKASVQYLPFGGTRTRTGTLGTDRKFTGQRLDGTGLYFYRARSYDAGIGRFISPGSPYTYAGNNPLGKGGGAPAPGPFLASLPPTSSYAAKTGTAASVAAPEGSSSLSSAFEPPGIAPTAQPTNGAVQPIVQKLAFTADTPNAPRAKPSASPFTLPEVFPVSPFIRLSALLVSVTYEATSLDGSPVFIKRIDKFGYEAIRRAGERNFWAGVITEQGDLNQFAPSWAKLRFPPQVQAFAFWDYIYARGDPRVFLILHEMVHIQQAQTQFMGWPVWLIKYLTNPEPFEREADDKGWPASINP